MAEVRAALTVYPGLSRLIQNLSRGLLDRPGCPMCSEGQWRQEPFTL